MGFDCSLHVVDVASLERFVDRFVGRSISRTAFDELVSDADERLAEARRIVSEDSFEGARIVTELALLFVSTETPHLYCRGFALSLWDEDQLGVPPPVERFGSVASHLGPILEAFPALEKEIPWSFDGNGCTGVFVDAEDVPHVLRELESALDAMRPGDRFPYEPLRRVLRVAAERKLAYWEGTDLDVESPLSSWFDIRQPSDLESVEIEGVTGPPHLLTRQGTRMCLASSGMTIVVDFVAPTPRWVLHENIHSISATFDASGRLFALASTDLSTSPYVFSLHEIDGTRSRRIADSLPFEPGAVAATNAGVIVFPSVRAMTSKSTTRPLILRHGALVPLAAPQPRLEKSEYGFVEFHCGAIDLADGISMVAWDGRACLVEGDALRTVGGDLEPDSLGNASDASVIVGRVTYAVSARRLVRFDAVGEGVSPIALDNVMSIAAGPRGSLILLEGWNPEADVFKVFWPDSSEVTSVPRSRFGEDDELVSFAHFSEAANRVFVGIGTTVRSLSWSSIEGLSRQPASVFEGVDRSRFPAAKKRRSDERSSAITPATPSSTWIGIVVVLVALLIVLAIRTGR